MLVWLVVHSGWMNIHTWILVVVCWAPLPRCTLGRDNGLRADAVGKYVQSCGLKLKITDLDCSAAPLYDVCV